ncbi:MAG TPA: L,D-transpeptidase, partial [Aggregatilineales bacterium]|nr:L,D-transpeptidase [Aggregatilineales bacterium]
PWTMYFDEGRALHGAYWHDGFGFRRSHGCVNLSITDARLLYDWVAEQYPDYVSSNVEEDGPAVWVYHSAPYR